MRARYLPRRRAEIGGLIALLWTGLACNSMPEEVRKSPNLLLISIDTLRSDHCSVYGYEQETTPFLEVLASEGLLFSEAYAPTSLTQPTHATLFTSFYPIAHRVIRNGLVLDDEYTTLAEVLRNHGYQTAGFVSSFPMNARFGLAQGFEHYDDEFEDGQQKTKQKDTWAQSTLDGVFDRRGNHTTDRVLNWLEEERDDGRPMFAFVHYFEPHAPYKPLAPYDSKFISAETKGLERKTGLYDGAVAFADREIGRLLRWFESEGLDEETVIVVTADHGEGLMEHGRMQHSVNVYEEAVRVPLIFRWQGAEIEQGVLEGPVSLVDVMPTILDLLEIERRPLQLQGHTLMAAMTGKQPLDAGRPIFLSPVSRTTKERSLGMYGVRVGDWKYIERAAEGLYELYNLRTDPEEAENVISGFPEERKQLRETLEDWFGRYRSAGVAARVTEEEEDALRALGYVD